MTPAAVSVIAIRAQETMNRAKPPRKMRRRPKTSPSAPAVTMNAAPTSE